MLDPVISIVQVVTKSTTSKRIPNKTTSISDYHTPSMENPGLSLVMIFPRATQDPEIFHVFLVRFGFLYFARHTYQQVVTTDIDCLILPGCYWDTSHLLLLVNCIS